MTITISGYQVMEAWLPHWCETATGELSTGLDDAETWAACCGTA